MKCPACAGSLSLLLAVCVFACAGQDAMDGAVAKKPVTVGSSICDKSICRCEYSGQGEVIDCGCDEEEQELDLGPLSGPVLLKKLRISNCRLVSFQSSSMSFSTQLDTLQISNVTNLTFSYGIFSNPLRSVALSNITLLHKVPSHLFHMSHTEDLVISHVNIGAVEERAFTGVSPQVFTFDHVNIDTIQNDAVYIAATPNGTFEMKNCSLGVVQSDGISVDTGTFRIVDSKLNLLQKDAIYARADVFELVRNEFSGGMANTSVTVNATKSLIKDNDISLLHNGALESISGKYNQNDTLISTPTLTFSGNKIARACEGSFNVHLDIYTNPNDMAHYSVSIEDNEFPCVCSTQQCNKSLSEWLVQQIRMSGSQQKKRHYTNILAYNRCYNTSCEIPATVVEAIFDTKLQCIDIEGNILQKKCEGISATSTTRNPRFQSRPNSSSQQGSRNYGDRAWNPVNSVLYIILTMLLMANAQ